MTTVGIVGNRLKVHDTMNRIKIAIVGVGNCASSLIQGIHYYREKIPQEAIGLMHWEIGGYAPGDIEVVAAVDIDVRKVGVDVHEAIFSLPNCTTVFCPDLPKAGVTVQMGGIMDGFSDHMTAYDPKRTFVQANKPEPTEGDIVMLLRESGVDILMNYLPVGSEKATEFYAGCALKAGAAFINNIPVFIASDAQGSWVKRFQEAGLPIIGSFMLSYTADKYDNLMRERFELRGMAMIRMGRDVRVLLIFIGAVMNLVLPVLVAIAVVMNIETIRRMKVASDA